MKLLWQCMFSPRLFKIYKEGTVDSMYQPQGLEKWGDKFITMANTLLNIGIYSSPFICLYIYKRGFFNAEEAKAMCRFFGGIGCLIAFFFIIRGIGRANSIKYVEFLKVLNEHGSDANENLAKIRNYDFEFHAWPVTYSVPPSEKASWMEGHPFAKCANTNLPAYQRAIIQVLAFVATHTFALRLIYPGTLCIIQNLLWTTLFQGRSQLVEEFDGLRTKILTADGNEIDTMFVDARKTSSKGKTVVICSEGNSGFYEIGIMTTPIRAGFSSLGWNHPGFAGSTGYPYPRQEQNAIDAVMQFAINELGFLPENIVMFGWSIGGYTSAWAAVKYPVKALILDATFDDLLPLAQNQMPSSWRLLVKEVVRSYVDLNISELLANYDGPLQVVRRIEDEIICLKQGVLASNRGNNLVVRMIETRHPELASRQSQVPIEPLDKYVALLETQRSTLIKSQIGEVDRHILQLINAYMKDYKSSHCTPLPRHLFENVMANITAQTKK